LVELDFVNLLHAVLVEFDWGADEGAVDAVLSVESNVAIISVVDKASDPWGVKIIRYEIKMKSRRALLPLRVFVKLPRRSKSQAGRILLTSGRRNKYIKEFGNLVKESVTLLISSPISEVCGMVGTLTGLIKRARMRQSELFIAQSVFCLLEIRNKCLSL